MKRPRTIVIGIDGCSPELVLRWKGELPQLARIVDSGGFARLQSTIPPVTCPAWISMFSGLNPGKLGIFDWLVFSEKRDEPIGVVNASTSRAPAVWDILGAHGYEVGLINVPMTYPPHPVNGFMVSGVPAVVHRSRSITYPAELQKELDRTVGRYDVLPYFDINIRGKERQYLEAAKATIQMRTRAITYLMSTRPWDLLVAVYFILDSVQHYFWHHMDRSHPWNNPTGSQPYLDAIKSVYQEIDRGIGEVLALAPKESNLLVVSDHGFGPLLGRFNTNEWLRANGFLDLLPHALEKKDRMQLRRHLVLITARLIGKRRKYLRPLLERIPLKLYENISFREYLKRTAKTLNNSLDWTRTYAYSLGEVGKIFLTRSPTFWTDYAKKDKREILEELGRLLKNIPDPSGQQLVPVKVFRREEIYTGEYLEQGPDIVFVIDDYRYSQSASLPNHSNSPWNEASYSGGHRRSGLFLSSGRDMADGGIDLGRVQIYDIAPIVLHIFGVPCPPNLDGVIPRKIFRESSELHSRRQVVARRSRGDRVSRAIERARYALKK